MQELENVVNKTEIDYMLNSDILDIKYFEENDELGRFSWVIYTKEKLGMFSPGCVLVAEMREDGTLTCWEPFDNHYVEMCEKVHINIDGKTINGQNKK
jgi:hypothetical protein